MTETKPEVKDTSSSTSILSSDDIKVDLLLEQIVGLEEAKEVLNTELLLRSFKPQPQKMILLEGPSGSGKTTLVEAIVKFYKEKYPDKLVYKYMNVYEVSAHVTTTAEKIHQYFQIIRNANRPIILFIDEGDEIFSSRLNAGHIRVERTTTLMKELNNEIPNLLIIAATNRPKIIDRAVLERFHRRVHCPVPTSAELRQIIDIHLSFLSEEQRIVLHTYMLSSGYKWSGRDIKHIKDELLTIQECRQLMCPEYVITPEEISRQYMHVCNSKAHLKDDYLND